MVVLGAYAQYQGNLAIDQAATAQAASTREAEQAQTAQAASTLAIQEANQRATAQVEAEQQARISRAGELAAIVALKRDNEIDLSLLLSVEAINFLDNYRTRANLLSALQAKPNPRQVLRKHSLSVSSIAYHPNGKMIASGGLDGQILLWDTITGKTIGKPIEVMKNIEPHLTFSPDGSILAFSDCDEIDDTYSFNVTCKTPVIILWDIAKKQEIRRFTVPNNNFIIKLEFSPDGNFIGSGSLGTVLLWDIVRGEVDDEIRVHPPFDFAFSPEGNILVASDCIETYADLSGIWCGNSALVVMDLSSPQREKHIFEGHRGWFDKLAFSPDGKWLVAGHRNSSSLSVWSVVDHTPKQVNIERQATAKITDIAFYYHGRTMIMATSQSDGNITLWDVPIIFRPTGRVLSGHVGSVNGLDFSPDGNVLATAGQDASIILWDLQNESVIKTPLQPEFSADTDAVAWDIDEKSLITVSSDSIYFWDIQSGNRTWKDLVDIQNVNRVSSFPERIVKFSLDSKTIAIGEGTMLRIWDVFTGEPVDLYFTHQSVVDTLTNVKDIAFRPNGNILAVGYDNGSLIFWDSATRKSIGEPILVGMGVNAIAFSPNGNTLASGDLSGTVSLWDVVTHEQVGQLRKAEDFLPEVVNIAFSSNGRLLASVDGSGAVTLWNVKTLEQIAAPRLDTNNAVLTVIFTPDNSTLISGSSGGTVMMWDMSSRQPIGELIGHTNAVNLISINPDGNLAVTSDAGGAMFLWDISIHSWVDKACGMVSRNLSQVEWQQYFPDEEYRITCPQWPAGE